MRSISRFRSSEVPRWFSQYVLNSDILLFVLLIYYKGRNLLSRLDCQQRNTTRGSGGLVSRSNESTCVGSGTSSFFLSFSMFMFNLLQARHEREMEEAEREEERANRAAQELDEQIQADAMRQLMIKEQQYKSRKRANSEATEVPSIAEGDFQVATEVFGHEMEINGVRFNAVKLFHPRSGNFFSLSPSLFFSLNHSTQAGLGIVYTADPIVDEIVSTSPLELYVVTFESQYYTTTQGRKKLKQVEQEIQKLTTVRHPKLITVFAVKLYMPHSSGPPQLMVLSEQLPTLTLHDVLEDSEFLKEDRVSVCVFFLLYF